MPQRQDFNSICIIGAGPIVIGQACEFDYSGTQACKALRALGYRVVLINSNPATIMTDPDLADATYIEPITPAMVAQILEQEKVQALLPTMGGQTALNTALALAKDGTLARLGVELIGASLDAIEKAEDRQKFRVAMDEIGLASPKSFIVRNRFDAETALSTIGLPAIIRPSFTLAGTGGGIAYNRQQFAEIVQSGLMASPVGEVLVEESVLGWKEYEMEVVRDKNDNAIIVCAIENLDPMGIHTGDSITVAPALTLTDKEYQMMRDASLAVLRVIGVETGGANVQFAINPADGRMVVIEMNPRVSRSSALASKATGFPIAKIAAQLAVGFTLDELKNDITRTTPASFEPTLDYVVVKIPRFAFEKFKGADATLTTSMKSVGEVMAMGRSFNEALQKALRGLETGLTGLDEIDLGEDANTNPLAVRAALAKPVAERLRIVAQALRMGTDLGTVVKVTKIDRWFIERIAEIIAAEKQIQRQGLPQSAPEWHRLKSMGFADARLATLSQQSESAVRAQRQALAVRPVFKRIDSCAAELAADTAYLYSTYEGLGLQQAECEARPSSKRKVAIIGGGPNRIGQGIEFDYCCVHAAMALREAGLETIMINCNPETVSTDPDTSDRLYFEPLTAEDVLEVLHKEQQAGTLLGVIVQFGGQTPLKLVHELQKANIPILGTSADAIDLAEDRQRFQLLLSQLGIQQPANAIATSMVDAEDKALALGLPVLVRPSYVLGGRAMQIVHSKAQLHAALQEAFAVAPDMPVLIDRYLQDATEVDVDVLADKDNCYIAGIMEHIEEAGIHSGDSACALPPFSLPPDIIIAIQRHAKALAKALNVVGLMNLQFAVKDGEIFMLEANPRASRTIPFVAKATGMPLAKMAAQIMAGVKSLADFTLPKHPPNHVAVKEAVFPFNRFPGIDVLLGPEMKSTGEVMGLDRDFGRAFAKAQLGAGVKLPKDGTVFLSVKDSDKTAFMEIARRLRNLGFQLMATHGTAKALLAAGIAVTRVNKVLEGSPHIVDALINGEVQLVLNTTLGLQSQADSLSIRRVALQQGIPYYTTLSEAKAVCGALAALQSETLSATPLQAYIAN